MQQSRADGISRNYYARKILRNTAVDVLIQGVCELRPAPEVVLGG